MYLIHNGIVEKIIDHGKDVSELEKGIRNSFKWFWLDQECSSGKKFGT